MDESKNIPLFSEVTKFHGYICPGTAIGYRAGEIAINELKASHATDEEILEFEKHKEKISQKIMDTPDKELFMKELWILISLMKLGYFVQLDVLNVGN